MRTFLVTSIFLVVTLTVAPAADYPDHPIRLIVPQAPGSATDNAARLIGAVLSQELGQQIIVDNRPGGALTIGLDLVAKSPPDGYTIGMGPIGALAITRHMVSKLPYDIELDFQPIALITRGQMLLAVSPKLPVSSVKELIDYARQNPGKLTNASSSNGSPGHVGAELFKYMTETKIVHVPYRGGSLAINDLIAGHVDLMFESLQSIAPFGRDGKVRALAVTGDHRSPSFPDLPTVAEAGVPGYEATLWYGLVAAARTPPAVLEKLSSQVDKTLRDPEIIEKLSRQGVEPYYFGPQEFASRVRTEIPKWAKVIKDAGVRIE